MHPGDLSIPVTNAERRAVEYGIDLSLLEENLKLTPLERMLRHDAAVEEIIKLQKQINAHGSRV
ncbi:MAG: hypothetical protein ABI443_05175 [Chthoniobacterales bacterium]